MNQTFQGWKAVRKKLKQKAEKQRSIAAEHREDETYLNEGQRASLVAIGKRIPNNGIVIADEVGMGKTRIAVELARAVMNCGGRVAILIPPGLGYQWQAEFQAAGLNDVPSILRSIKGYLDVWSKENDMEPWFQMPAVLISHRFANWRMSDSSAAWRWALVPELYARWRKRRKKRWPNGYCDNEVLAWGRTCHQAAKSIDKSIKKIRSPEGKMLEQLGDVAWRSTTDASSYSKNGELRIWLERCVGLGLGRFDLVIVDEAHKSRKTGSGLSRLLNTIVMTDTESRRVGLTATPVELGIEQWSQTLARIGLSEEQLTKTQEASQSYADAVKQVRITWRSSSEALEKFSKASKKFESTLSPFLLRRDKREDLDVQKFAEYSKLPYHQYRCEKEVAVDTGSLSPSWKAAICAAEALSVVTRQADDPVAKRLRLTLGNGHGISAILDQLQRDEHEDAAQEKVDRRDRKQDSPNNKQVDKKRKARAEWWMSTIANAFGTEDRLLFDHPAILKAVETIESETQAQNKVLVFGRFTRPMRALVNLLNAREMLRRLEKDEPWPQAKVHGTKTGQHKESEWPAVRAAHKQLSCTISIAEIDERLEKAYSRTQNQRKKIRESIPGLIELGLQELEDLDSSTLSLFDAFKKSIEQRKGSEINSLAIVSRAILSLHGTADASPTKSTCAKAFAELVVAASDRDDPDSDDDPDEEGMANRWETILERLTSEYNRPEGGFARLMYGGTSQDSRRMMQLAFNRLGSFPKVLVAQSMVGREGLNLHKSCRRVVLLHPEWNPAMVEQQIGRVDRVDSLWCRDLGKAISNNVDVVDLPRIEVRGIVFSGTYDELNWEVLKKRWDDLRAQLHGIVIPPSELPTDEEGLKITNRISELTPNFSPKKHY
jgi:superfamily II DNA or RNA helicase